MIYLVLGLVLFLGVHSISIYRTRLGATEPLPVWAMPGGAFIQ